MTFREWVNLYGSCIIGHYSDLPLKAQITGIYDFKLGERIEQPFMVLRKSNYTEYEQQMATAGQNPGDKYPYYYEVGTD